MPTICHLAGLKGQTSICMIDWSDLDQQRNGLFAAVCLRKRGLPLLSWATVHDEGIAAELSLASKSLCVSARIAVSFRWGGNGEPGAVLGSGASGTLVSGDFAAGRQGGALSPADAVGAVLS